jgi:anti-sigma B factor antagonist
MEQMEIERTSTASTGVFVFRLKGPFTLGTMFELQSALREPDVKGCIIDFGEVPYIDSAGLGVILGHFAHTQRSGTKMALVGISPRVHKIFEITHTDQILPIFTNPEDAHAIFTSSEM